MISSFPHAAHAEYRPNVQFQPLGESLCLNGPNWLLKQTKRGEGRRRRATSRTHTPWHPDPARARMVSCSATGRNAGVPGSVQTALIEAKLVPSPWYYAGNILALAKATRERDSLFRTSFHVPGMVRDDGPLVLRAVDYQAAFYVNGHEVGRHEGPLAGRARCLQGIALRRRKRTDGRAGSLSAFRSHLGTGTQPHWRSQILKNMLTDCTPPACPLGISDDVFLLATEGLAIDDLGIRTRLNGDCTEAVLEMTLTMTCEEPGEAEVLWEVRPRNFSRPHPRYARERILLGKGKQDVAESLKVPQPALWWPHGSGETGPVRSTGDRDRQGWPPAGCGAGNGGSTQGRASAQSRFAQRLVVPHQWPERVLERRNWVPSDPFYRANRDTYVRLLRQATTANLNALRWWGGGVPERPAFYELCDELGILIYQDFPLANDNFDNPQMLAVLEGQAADFFRRWQHPTFWPGTEAMSG